MMNHLNRITKGRYLLLLFLLFLFSYLLLNTFHHPASILSIKEMSGGHTILNLLPFYDSDLAYEYLMAYPPKAVIYYYRVLILDLILVIPIYVAFFSVGISFFLKEFTRLNLRNIQLIAATPIIAGILNLIEDAMISVLLIKLPNQLPELAALSGFLTLFKSIIIAICLLAIIIMSLVFAIKYAIKKTKPST